MSTILFNEIIFGPLHSRRLGTSLGINLLPYDGKICSFDCIYCECGYNEDFRTKTRMPTRDEVRQALEAKLTELKNNNTEIDVITFSGNGEPTMHPDFTAIIDDTIALRNKLFANVKISVLTNATNIDKENIFNSLKKIENNILKLDSAFLETVKLIDQPNSPSYSIEKQVKLFKKFEGNFILQTMFLRGTHNGKIVDNTTEKEIDAWLNIVKETKPKQVMIYTISRETPEKNLNKVSLDELNRIGEKVKQLGIDVIVSG